MRLYETLNEAHQWARRHFEYRPDPIGWTLPELPTVASLIEQLQRPPAIVRGECTSFARLCQWRLREAHGIEARLIMCLDEANAGHLVASVLGWILDNRHEEVKPREELQERGYWFLLEESGSGAWNRIVAGAKA